MTHDESEGAVREFLADANLLEGVSIMGGPGAEELGMGRVAVIARVPSFDPVGVPGADGGARASTCETQWTLVRDDDAMYAVLLIEWPNGASRKIQMDMGHNSTETLLFSLVEFATPQGVAMVAITPTPRGLPEHVCSVQLDLAGDEVFGMALFTAKGLRKERESETD